MSSSPPTVDVGVLFGIGIILSTLLQLAVYIYGRLRHKKEHEVTLQERIKQLTSSLEDASKVVGEVEKAVEERRELARKLEQDAQTYKSIISLKKDEVEAVAQLLRGELKKEERRGIFRDLLMNFGFFLLGTGVTYFLLRG